MSPEELIFINNYNISNLGSIYSKHSNRLLKWDTSTGYARVVLSNKGKTKKFSVHRLVAYKYLKNPLNKPCVNHIDGNKLNNSSDNLQWCTHSENERHSFDVLGKKIKHSKETKDKIRKATNRHKSYLKNFKYINNGD